MSFAKSIIRASVIVAFSGTAALAGDFVQIKKKGEFKQVAVGKKLSADWGWVTPGSDGTLVGQAEGGAVSGSWKWQGKFFCRTLIVGDNDLGKDCQTVHHSGDRIVFIRDRGKGEQYPMKIQ